MEVEDGPWARERRTKRAGRDEERNGSKGLEVRNEKENRRQETSEENRRKETSENSANLGNKWCFD
jgi:hypothetical protein